MRIVLLSIVFLMCVYGAYGVYRIYRASELAKGLIRDAVSYTRTGEGKHTMLVLGDSTAVGVGASREESVPARFATFLDASVENYAVSGARTKDIASQRVRAKRDSYDTVLIHIGANEIVGIGSLADAANELGAQLTVLSPIAKRVIVLTAGDIGAAPVFVWPLNAIISYRTRVLRQYFTDVCAKYGAVYVDIYAEPNIINMDIEKYYAPDGFHLKGDGYGYWFSIVKKYLDKESFLH
jgi:lysophospholipase L1-like esterase